jgi:hypothetical protein
VRKALVFYISSCEYKFRSQVIIAADFSPFPGSRFIVSAIAAIVFLDKGYWHIVASGSFDAISGEDFVATIFKRDSERLRNMLYYSLATSALVTSY